MEWRQLTNPVPRMATAKAYVEPGRKDRRRA